MRETKTDYYLNLAAEVAKRGTCLRRNYGAIIVKNDEIIATGYTGAPRGSINCCETGECERQRLGIPSGQRYELCRSVHAEMNAIISAPRSLMLGATLYLAGWEMEDGNFARQVELPQPCQLCKRVIVNAGIKEVVTYKNHNATTEAERFDKVAPTLWLVTNQL